MNARLRNALEWALFLAATSLVWALVPDVGSALSG